MRIEGACRGGRGRGEVCGACAALLTYAGHMVILFWVVVALPLEAVGVGDRVTLSISQRERLRAVLLVYTWCLNLCWFWLVWWA